MGYVKLDSRFNICIFHNFPQNASPSLDTLLGNSHKVHFVYIQCGYQLEGRGQRKGQKGGKRKDKGREEQNECIMNKRRFLHSSCRESATAVFFFFFQVWLEDHLQLGLLEAELPECWFISAKSAPLGMGLKDLYFPGAPKMILCPLEFEICCTKV